MKLAEIKKSKLYLIEKETHDKYCDGEGMILKFNIFSGARIEEECPFCKRISAYRLRKHLERTEGYGGTQTTDSDVIREDQDDQD